MDDIENRTIKTDAIRINILKNAEKLSTERNDLVSENENAALEVPNSNSTKIKVIANPIIDINGRNFFCLLKIKSKITNAIRVKDKIISG